MQFKTAGLAALLIMSWAPLAAAGPTVDAATRAETLAAEGNTVEALDALNEAVDALWASGPLAFRTVTLVDSVGGVGVYEERADPTYKPDDKLTVYVEPVGFGYGAGGSGIGFTADLTIENSSGQTLSETDGVFDLSTTSSAGQREFYMALSFEVPFLRPGAYTATFTVHDKNSDKSAGFDIAFNVVLPDAQ